ncbi:MAG: Zn-dependent alcohol dehydrogenase [Candidatus Poribacteria bacterium]|nr:Zn-dependent alcohol dehydrogenase [Candidatus Poribacteria bacterium]
MQTKAAVVYEHNKAVVVEELDLEEPKADEVLIRMAASGVCHSDLSVVNGTIYYDPPVSLGHEGAGVVERVGENVSYVRPGDHVVLSFVSYCGSCRMCQMERASLCEGFSARRGRLLDDTCRRHNKAGQPIPQMARIGTMAEYSVVPEQSLIKVDSHYPLDKAVLVGCGVTTGVCAVLNTAKVEPGSWVAVIGTGGVGLNAIQGAVLAGAERIFAIDRVPKKLDFARDFGATDTVNASDCDPVEAMQDLTGGKGVDYAFEVIGNSETIEQAYAMVRPAGTAVVIGLARPEAQVSLPASSIVQTEKRLIGSFYGSAVPRVDMPKLLQLYDEGKLKIDELITQNYRIEEINEAFADMEAGKNARGVILFDS